MSGARSAAGKRFAGSGTSGSNPLCSSGELATNSDVVASPGLHPAERIVRAATQLRGRGHIFGESFGRLFAGGLAPFLMEPYTGSATIFFGPIFVVVWFHNRQ